MTSLNRHRNLVTLALLASTLSLSAVAKQYPNTTSTNFRTISSVTETGRPLQTEQEAIDYLRGKIYEMTARKGGTNTGGTNRGDVKFVTQWCYNSVADLNDARERAFSAAKHMDVATARETLRNGLVTAIQNAADKGLVNSMSLRMMKNTLTLSDVLYVTLLGDEYRENRTMEFLERGYELIIQVSEEFDVGHYLPYVMANRPFDAKVHERKLATYAGKQIKWLLEGYMIITARDYYTAYNPKIFLLLAEYISYSIGTDLVSTLFGTAYACQIRHLELLSQRLAEHNTGGKIYMNDDREATRSTVPSLQQIQDKLTRGCAN